MPLTVPAPSGRQRISRTDAQVIGKVRARLGFDLIRGNASNEQSQIGSVKHWKQMTHELGVNAGQPRDVGNRNALLGLEFVGQSPDNSCDRLHKRLAG